MKVDVIVHIINDPNNRTLKHWSATVGDKMIGSGFQPGGRTTEDIRQYALTHSRLPDEDYTVTVDDQTAAAQEAASAE